MIIDIVTLTAFHDRLINDFSYEACGALYKYYEDLSNYLGEPINFDPIAIRCDWHECEDFGDVFLNYDYLINLDEIAASEEIQDALLDELERRTTVIELDIGYLVQAF